MAAMNEMTVPIPASGVARVYDAEAVRADFPILARQSHGKPLAFLDSAASAQKPHAVIDAVRRCYEQEYANVHRGVYELSARTTEAFEEARCKVARFLNASSEREIVFTRGATEAINLVAASFGGAFFSEGDEIVLSTLEHHSNIVPWQLLRERTGVVLRVVPINDRGELDMASYADLLGPRTRLVAVTHASNALGTLTPVDEIIRLAHQRDVPVLLDGCQAVPHRPVDVAALDVDFYVFSGHKLYGPSGIGALYAKRAHLEAMPPWQGGGDMIKTVSFEATVYADPPAKFEAGTPNIAGSIGLGAAVDYISAFDRDALVAHEDSLLDYTLDRLADVEGVRLIGEAQSRASIVSFVIDGAHSHDVGTILDGAGVAVRVGHHCAQPVMDHFGITGTVRASFGIYSTQADADALVAGLAQVKRIFD